MPVKSDWATQLEVAVDRALEDGARSRFWESGASIPDALVTAAARDIATQIAEGTAHRERAACLFLFHLLRTHLRNVRVNRFWPEVANALAELSSAPVDAARCAPWFRKSLLRNYEHAIEDVHHRYVACAFDEAGVGFDRFRIVRDFLERLTVGFGETDPAEHVADELARYLRESGDREDVEALAPMLRRTGIVLGEVAAHLQRGGAGFERVVDDWDAFREYWKNRTGVDLERLLPEAREILSELLPRIGGRLSRAGLIAKLRDGEMTADFPACVSVTLDHTDPRRVPLSSVFLTVGNSRRTFVLCDEFGLIAEQIVRMTPDKWHSAGSRGFYCWRKEPFEVSSGLRRERAVPLVPGVDASRATIAGYFWSGSLQSDSIPVAQGIGPIPDVPPQLRVSSSWRAGDGGVFLSIDRFVARFLRYSGTASLCVGDGRSIWKGEIEAGRPTSTDSFPLEISDEAALAGVKAVLRDSAGRQLCEKQIDGVLARDLVLFISSRLRSSADHNVSRWDITAGFPHGVVLCARSRVAITGGSSTVMRERYPTIGWHALRLEPEPTAATLNIKSPTSHITISIHQPASLMTSSLHDLVVDGIELRGIGGLCPVTLSDPMELNVAGLTENGRRAGRLIVTTATAQHRIPLWELSDLIECLEGKPGQIAFSGRSLLAALGAECLGLVCCELSTPLGGGGQDTQVAFFRLPESLVTPATVAGAQADLFLGGTDTPVAHIVSTSACRFEDVLERKRVSGLLYFDDGIALAARWSPVVVGAVVRNDDGTIATPSFAINLLGRDSRLCLIGPEGMEVDVVVNDVRRRVAGPCDVPLGDLLGHVSSLVSDRYVSMSVRWDGQPIAAWTIDLTPTNVAVSSAWQSASTDDLSLVATVSWSGRSDSSIAIALLADDRETVVALPVAGNEQVFGRFEKRVTISVDAISRRQLAAGCHAKVLARWGSVLLACRDMPPPPSETVREMTPDELKAEIRCLIDAIGTGARTDDTALEELLYLMEAYFARVGTLPFAVDPLIERIHNAGSDDCRSDVIAGLRLLDALGLRDEHRVTPQLPRSRGRLGVFLATLRVVAERRASSRGLANPDTLRALSRILDFQSGETSVTAWARCAAGYCRATVAELAGGTAIAEIDSQDACTAARHPLLTCDSDILSWIRNRCREDEHVGQV